MPRPLLLALLLPFAALTTAALWQHGYLGILLPHFRSLAGGQVLADLAIALSLVLAWLWKDARSRGRNPWPWLVATLALGSFGPLLYLISLSPGANSGRPEA